MALAVGLVGLGAVSGKIATHVRVGLGAFALGTGVVGAHVLSFNALGLQPGVDWQLLSLVAAVSGACGGCMMALGAFFRGGDRSKPPTVPWQATAAFVLGATLVVSQQLVAGAAGLGTQTGSLYAERIGSTTLALFASLGSVALLVVGLIFSILEARLRRSLRRAESELQRRSFRDGLTRLPNRLMFEGMLAQACQQADATGERMAMLFIDLDGFKPVNESLGHHMGDLMLREIATRLKRFARPDDRVAHLGGDEFLMLIRGNPSEEDAVTFAERMQGQIGEPCKMNGREAAVSSSIGIAIYPEHGAMQDLIAHAEAAMRAAKSGGGASHCFFEPRMVSGARDQFDLLRDLRRALGEGQLHLLYQPKVHAPSGEITGAEALMRWNHPQRGLVAPAVFIPIAERFGLIGAIGNWLIDEACRQAGQWRDEGLRMRVAINLSAHQLRHDDLADRIDAALKRHRIDPQLLTCEITESVAMEDASNAIRMVEKLGAMGVNISIDDFGTGYSSLAYLRKLRAGELKIDRSFVMDLEASADARAVVDAVVKLAQALGLKVVAEGVETEAQHEILRAPRLRRVAGLPVRPADVGDGAVGVGDRRGGPARHRVPRLALQGDRRRRAAVAGRAGSRTPAPAGAPGAGASYNRGHELPGLHPRRGPAADPHRTHRRPRRCDGHDDPAPSPVRGRLPGRALQGPSEDLKGNNELLQLTRPDVIAAIHEQYLAAGADIIETNTFGATSVAQDDYGLGALAREMNVAGAQLARAACDRHRRRKAALRRRRARPDAADRQHQPRRQRPGARNVTFDQLRAAYCEQAEGLLEGGADLFLVETIFDTLNAKAAIFALDELMEESGERLPVIVSGTVTDASGRILSGQTVAAFWHSVRHARPLAVGLNCALGAALMRPYIEELAKVAGDTFVCCYPNAGLPNPMSETGFDETPDITAGLIEEFAKAAS